MTSPGERQPKTPQSARAGLFHFFINPCPPRPRGHPPGPSQTWTIRHPSDIFEFFIPGRPSSGKACFLQIYILSRNAPQPFHPGQGRIAHTQEEEMERLFRKILFMLAGVCLALTLTTVLVAAQDYKSGSTYFEPRGGVYGTFSDHVKVIATYGGALGYFILDNFSLEAEGLGYYIDQQKIDIANGIAAKNDTATAFGGSLMARWHIPASESATFFIGAGAGGLWADRKVPYNGMQYSVTEQAELGATVRITDGFNLKLAGRYQHIGCFDKTGLSALGGNLGLQFTF
ncbi:outer membrane beta-barrel protein [Desulfolutivibrio sulfoxidireducens]|nr:outer membrane beta-barrel protein [Desulfolutivibrio sulfoxidireducens]